MTEAFWSAMGFVALLFAMGFVAAGLVAWLGFHVWLLARLRAERDARRASRPFNRS